MKTFTFKFAFIALILSFSYTLKAHVEIDYPLGGETFISGTTVTIQWHIAIPHNTLNWDVLFSSDGGMTWEAIQMNLPPGQLSYQWIVPAGVTTQGRISVIQDNDGMDYQDETMNFTIEALLMPPSIDMPASDITIECNLTDQQAAIQDWLNDHGGAMVTNFCGDLDWTNDFTGLSNDCGASGSALVTFTASDECGSVMTDAYLTIVDSDSPVIEVPATDVTVECNGNGNTGELNNWLNSHAGAVASDACGNVNWTNNYNTLSNGCGTTGSKTVIFTATDECGHTITTSATFTIVDSVPPAINEVAQDTTIECGATNQADVIQTWLENHGSANASDICGNVTWSNNFPVVSDTCSSTLSLLITFTAYDECGNSSATNATFTILGTSATSNSDFPDLGFRIFPNPAGDILQIDFDKSKSMLIHLVLLDAWGKPHWFYQGTTKEIFIPVSEYPSGVYFLQVETAKGAYSRKVIIE